MNPLHDIIALLLPRKCHVCKCHLARHEQHVCQRCLSQLPTTHYHRITLNPMEQRFAGVVKFQKATAMYIYTRDSGVATIIQDFKYKGFPSLARFMGRTMAEQLLTTGFFNDIDLIIPIPLHFTKHAKRGYNQSHMLAKGISSVIDRPVSTTLYASKSHSTQTSKDHYQRWQNTRDIFSVRHPDELKGRHILLVDDVCTTGATLIAAAQAVLRIPDTQVSILTLAATPQ